MMDDTERRRLDLTRRVTNNLRRRELGCMYPARDDTGVRVVLAVLPDDTIADVFGRVQRAGGAVNVVVDDPWTVVVFEPAPDDEPSSAADDVAALHPDCHIGLLVETLRHRHGSKLRCHLAEPDYSMQLVPDGGLPRDLLSTP